MQQNEKSKKISCELVQTSDFSPDYMRENVKRLMALRDLRLQDLADLSGMNIETLKTFLYQGSRSVTLNTAVKLARGLGVSIDELTGAGTIDDATRVSMQLMRDLPDYTQHYVRWIVKTLHTHYQENGKVKKLVPIMKTECDANGDIRLNNDFFMLDVSYLPEMARPKVFSGINIPCDAYMPKISPYSVLLVANDRPAKENEYCVIINNCFIWVAKRRVEIENGRKIVKYYSIRDGKYRCSEYDIETEMGYVAAVHMLPHI